MKRLLLLNIPIALVALLLISSCGSSADGDKEEQIIEEVFEESSSDNLYKFNNTLFSVPSPYEVSILMKESGVEYNPDIVNPVSNSVNYTSNFLKAINMGVYGSDLAYLNMNEQIPEATKYFATIKILAEELQLSASFDVSVIKRIENNMGNEDSLLNILSKVYRNTDKYLKENQRQDLGVLIISGGWIESLYFLTEIAQTTNFDVVKTRLGEQKYPLDNLIKILTPYYNKSEEYTALIESLIDLAYVYDGIDVEYTYAEPSIDKENKITTINSSSKLLMNQEHVVLITDKIRRIRDQIIN